MPVAGNPDAKLTEQGMAVVESTIPAEVVAIAHRSKSAITGLMLLFVCACSAPTSEEASRQVEVRPDSVPTDGGIPHSAESASPSETNSSGPAGDADVDLSSKGSEGDGSQIILSSLSEAEIVNAKIDGELSCAFENDPSSILLIAGGYVKASSSARGIVKIGDYVEHVAAQGGGGFDAMLNGVTFSGRGKTIRISVTSAVAGATTESPRRHATLTYQRADGAKRTLPGLWACGP